ncbi:MAG: hypothetical protein Q4F72_10940, partial [Desulfovibrionaceae bacterium]|nr:hypothetical protein [Desulfovibrionaceae bacterium]
MSSMTDEHGAGGLHGGSEAAGTMTGGPGAAGSMTGGPMEHGSAAGGSAEAGSQNAAGAGAAEDARGRTAGAATVPVSGVAFQHCLPGRHGTLVAGLVWERVTDAPAGLSGLNAAGARTRSGRRSRRSAGQTSGQTFDQTGGQPSGPTLGQAYGQSGGRPSSEACASVYDHRLVQDDLAGLGALSGPAPAPKAPTSLAALILRLRGEGVEIWPLPASRAPEGRTFRSLMEGILAAGKARETGAAPEAAAQASSEDASGSPCCWYVWAARQGRLSARADRCLASREEALRLAASLADSLGLDGVHELSPAQVEAELAALDRLPGSSWRACRLKAIGPARSRRHAGLALAAVAAAGLLMGGQAVWTHWQEGGFSSVSAASEKEKLRNAILAHPERHFAAGFVTAPSAADFARTALPAMLAFPAQASGWQLEALTASVIPEKAQGKAGGASDRNRARDKAPDTADTTDSRT